VLTPKKAYEKNLSWEIPPRFLIPVYCRAIYYKRPIERRERKATNFLGMKCVEEGTVDKIGGHTKRGVIAVDL
jgi:hypothetical protein